MSTRFNARHFAPTRLAVAFAAAGITSAIPVAQAADSDDAQAGLLDRIVVSARATHVADVAGSVQFLDAPVLKQAAYNDINRILRLVPGVNLVEEDGFGLRPNIGIRGSGTDRNSKIAVMEDGVLIAPAPYAAPSAYYFPRASRMTGVEISKGPAAIKYGPQTVAGALNLFSAPVPTTAQPLGGDVAIYGGNFGTWRGHARASARYETTGPVDVGFMIETLQEHSDGFKNLDSGGSTGYRIEDYVAKLQLASKAGARFEQVAELKLQYSDETSDETYLGLTLDDFAADPYRRYRASQLDQMNVDHKLLQFSHRIVFNDVVDVTTMAYYTETARAWYKLNDVASGGSLRSIAAVTMDPVTYAEGYQNLVGASGYTSAVDALRVRNNNREYYSAGVQSVVGIRLEGGASEHLVEASFRYHEDEEDRFQQDDRYQMVDGAMVMTTAGAPGSNANRIGAAQAWAFYLRDTVDIGRWTLVPGVRYETIDLRRTDYAATDPDRTVPASVRDNDVDVWIPGLGARYALTDSLSLVGGVHRGFASPAPGSTADAELSWNYEGGMRYGNDAVALEVVGYFNDFSNLVGTCTNSTGGGCQIGDQYDGGSAHVWGVEVMAQYDAAASVGSPIALPVSVTYTYTKGEFRSSFNSAFEEWGNVSRGDEMPHLSPHQLTLRAGAEAERWRVYGTMSYVSRSRAVAGNGPIPATRRIDARTIFDVSAEVDVIDNVSVFGSIQNLTDEVYNVAWTPAGARPGLPRTFTGGVRLAF
ncbi:MAG: TonB-dependent receptor [Gammaproteobacteria bacterium]|nr:TonB-dependent receptor [Gammaproteobacteria bacterium]